MSRQSSNSSTAINTSLLSLLPTSHYTATTLPPRLVSLATSIHTSSRARAPTLKPDEEIARTYACAHLAIERFRSYRKAGGGLEVGERGVVVRPPCGGRVYKKLKGFLEGVLLSAQQEEQEGRTVMPKKRATTTNPSVVDRQKPDLPAKKLVKRSDTTSTARPVDVSPRPNRNFWYEMELQEMSSRLRVPEAAAMRAHKAFDWVCQKSVKGERITPSVWYASVCAAVLVVVCEETGKYRVADRPDTLRKVVRNMVSMERMSAPQADAVCRDATLLLDEDAEGWQETDWFGNIVASKEDAATESDGSAGGAPGETGSPRHQKGPIRGGLGTMFQARVDWLSEDRQADYIRWKRDIMRNIYKMEKLRAPDQRTSSSWQIGLVK